MTDEIKGAASIVYNIELRDLFAGFAVQGIISVNPQPQIGESWLDVLEKTVKASYIVADAMLEARKK
jgi:hypothetical protein